MSELRISLPNPCGENWDEMQPAGCNRICAACSETIHDLAELTSQEVEALLRKPEKHCVRARVGPDGALALRPSHLGHSQKMIVVVGASISLLASACATLPKVASPTGAIAGKVDPWRYVQSVEAIGDNGSVYRTVVRADGSYRFKRLPYGTYSLKFTDLCGVWDGERVILNESKHPIKEPSNSQDCIVVGMAKFEDDRS
jgi:hypothetical protein